YSDRRGSGHLHSTRQNRCRNFESLIYGSVKIRPEETSLSRVHYELIRGLIENGSCPSNFELVRRLDMASAQIEQLLQKLSEIHGVVLHPHICEPWVVHPF